MYIDVGLIQAILLYTKFSSRSPIIANVSSFEYKPLLGFIKGTSQSLILLDEVWQYSMDKRKLVEELVIIAEELKARQASLILTFQLPLEKLLEPGKPPFIPESLMVYHPFDLCQLKLLQEGLQSLKRFSEKRLIMHSDTRLMLRLFQYVFMKHALVPFAVKIPFHHFFDELRHQLDDHFLDLVEKAEKVPFLFEDYIQLLETMFLIRYNRSY